MTVKNISLRKICLTIMIFLIGFCLQLISAREKYVRNLNGRNDMVIWKVELASLDEQYVELPEGAKILCVQMQRKYPCIWALYNEKNKTTRRKIIIKGTEHRIDNA